MIIILQLLPSLTSPSVSPCRQPDCRAVAVVWWQVPSPPPHDVAPKLTQATAGELVWKGGHSRPPGPTKNLVCYGFLVLLEIFVRVCGMLFSDMHLYLTAS